MSPWRRERLPTPVFWPGEFHGLYNPWGCKELDTTEQLTVSLLSEVYCSSVYKTKLDISPVPTVGKCTLKIRVKTIQQDIL